MNIYVKKFMTSLLACTLLIGLIPGTITKAATDVATPTTYTESVTPTGLSLGELETKMDAYMKDYIGDTIPGAAITIVKDNQVVLQKGYGYSNVEAKTTVDSENTVFRYGNLSQIYTWTAILQLAEQGKVDLEANILTYLPENFASKLKEHLISENAITLTHLMNHTAGFEEVGHDTVFSDSGNLEENLEQGLLITMPNQIYAPGQVLTGDSYSAALAAFIIEQVSGMPYENYIKTYILDKIGANHTVFLKNEETVSELGNALAPDYLKDADGNFVALKESYSNLYPNNSLCGTASDLTKLMNQLMQGKEDSTLLSKASLDIMYKKSYAITEEAKACLHGLYEYPADIKAYYCDGGTSSTSIMVMMPTTGFGLVITTNTSAALELLYGLSYELLLGDAKAIVTAKDDLPIVSKVTDRQYVGTRRPYGGVLEFIGYYSNCSKFTRVDKNTISLGDDHYVQVAPYVYKYAGDNTSPLYKTLASTIYFKEDDAGKAYKWSYSCSGTIEYYWDIMNKSQEYLSMTIFFLIVSILFIVVMFLASIYGLIKDVIKCRFNWKGVRLAYGIFMILLALTVLNNWAIFNDISSVKGLFASSINIHIILNVILSALELISLVYLIYRMRNERQTRMKNILIVFTVIMYIGSVYFLQTWNFYSIM